MFKINKNLWYTLIIYLTLELALFLGFKFTEGITNVTRGIYLAIISVPLIIIIILWIIGKIRKSRIKTQRVKGLTPRDKELIFHYAGTKEVDAISYQELGRIWFLNSLAYYLAAIIAFVFGFGLYALLEFL